VLQGGKGKILHRENAVVITAFTRHSILRRRERIAAIYRFAKSKSKNQRANIQSKNQKLPVLFYILFLIFYFLLPFMGSWV